MHGSGGEKWKRSRHMWPVPNSTVTTVPAHSDPKSLDFFCKDGRKIQVGDCALFKPPKESPPFIGIIRRLTLDAEDTLSLGVNWLYRPADIRLSKGILLEAAPNEVFYSFHKDEIPAASLLHPCRVAFLRKGVELSPGISSFVCRRVYDIENKCLWWLTDKDYINERQEEVDQLLDKTRLEMHGAVQSGGRSPKPLNGPSSTPQLKSGSDSLQNSASSFSSQAKGKKRERVDQASDSVKRERLSKTEDGDSGQIRPEIMLKSEIAKITDKGGLVDSAGVEKLVQLMQPDSADKKLDLAGRIMLVDVIAVTDKFECLGQFVQLRGLPVLDEWLQEVHKGKIGDGSSPKENDRSIEEFLLALLRALDKLPVNLHALQTCNVGKSVNYLRSHKNSEIQKKARSLVDTWKRRVEAEMNMNDAKSGATRGVSWQNKPASSEVSHVGSRKLGNSAEVGSKSSTAQPSISKSHQVKLGPGDTISKSSASLGSAKPMGASISNTSKDQNFRLLVGAASSDVPLTPIKEEKSSSSSQSQNNSQSSEHAKTMGSSYREDARSSTAGSVSVSANKVSSASRHRKSSNGFQGSAISGVQKETGSGKVNAASRNLTSEKLSTTTGASQEKIADGFPNDQGTSRLIVRFPNTGRSPARGSSGVSFEDPVSTYGKASPPREKHDNHDRKMKTRNDTVRVSMSTDVNSDACQSKVGGFEENIMLASCGEQQRASEDGDKATEVSKVAGSLSKMTSRAGKSYDPTFSSMNALIESCAKISRASVSTSPGDDVGMNLLASVAAGEISKSDNVSPCGSPGRNPSTPEGSSSGNDGKFNQGEDVAQVQCQPSGGVNGGALSELGDAGDSLNLKSESRHPNGGEQTNDSGESNTGSPPGGERTGECIAHLDGSSGFSHNVAAAAPAFSDHKLSEQHDSMVVTCTREGCMDADGALQFHEDRKFGVHRTRSTSISDSKLEVHVSSPDEDKKAVCTDERTMENNAPMISEAASDSAKVEKDNEKSTCLSSEMGGEDQNADKDSSNDARTDPKPSLVAITYPESLEGKTEDSLPGSVSGNNLNALVKGEKADDVKAEGGVTEWTDRQAGDFCSSASEHDKECGKEKLEIKDSLGHLSVAPAPHLESSTTTLPKQENEQREKSITPKTDAPESSEAEERQLGRVDTSGPDTSVKLDFDLNEGFPLDEPSHGDLVKTGDPAGNSSAIHLPCPLPFQSSSVSVGFPASITVAAPAKGAFNPPENLMRNKGELGWKGSAATSAFRPAEPRKGSDVVDSSVSKPGRAPLDFDLNVADVVADDDESGPSDRGAGSGGLDLDLNRVDDSDTSLLSGSANPRLEITPLPTRSSLSGALPNGGANISRDFDLNNGPGLDEVATESAPRPQPIKSSIPLPSTGPVSGMRMNNAEYGNFSSWFPPANTYSAISVPPPIFTARGEQSYIAPAGLQRVLGGPPTASTSFGHEMYRGPVLSSSPAVGFPPAGAQIPYPGFPFEPGFPLSSNSFSGAPAGYMDTSSGGPLCFPTIPSPLVGPGGIVSTAYPRPYVMNLPGGASSIGPDGRKWGSQSGLDLNAGPGGVDTERRDERLVSGVRQQLPGSQALMEEQLKMFQVGGGVLKRKEPDGGRDAVDRISYKQPSWQ